MAYNGVLDATAQATRLTTVDVAGETHVLMYDRESGRGLLLRASSATAEPPQHDASILELGPNLDLLDSFVLGNLAYILGYVADGGRVHIFQLTQELRLVGPYTYSRTREPGVTVGFSTIRAFTTYGKVGILGYNDQNGYVALYSVDVLARSTDDLPPLALTNTWSHQWAKGWTRFAFFTQGGAVFFLKTNTWRPNVNVDHVWDHLQGTTEVASHLDLRDAQELVHVIPVIPQGGDTYFLTYREKNGVLYRFRGDCAGWTEALRLDLPSDITDMIAAPTVDGAVVFALTPGQ